MSEAIRCQGLTKRFGKVTAVDNLTLAVEECTVFGFLGPNGAGKTTTIKLLTGLGQPTAGQLWVAGEPVSPGSISFKAKIGYLPETPTFYNWMTGRQFILYVAELFGLPPSEAKTRCGELLEVAGLGTAADRRIGGYSRGMKQRLGIAQALVNRPQVLFLDEPCSALDPVGRREVLALVQQLSKDTTVFMSSHILADVERTCSAVGIINHGRLVAQSTIEELRHERAVAVFELQFEEDGAAFARKLESIPWVRRTETQAAEGSPVLRVYALDVATAKRELPGLVAASGLTLLRYEVALPNLEAIFVELVGAEPAA